MSLTCHMFDVETESMPAILTGRMKMTEQLNENGLAQSGITGAPTHEEISVRAYHLWEKAGKPQARELECWLQAEAELRLESEKIPGAICDTLAIPLPKKKAPRTPSPVKMVKSRRRLPASE